MLPVYPDLEARAAIVTGASSGIGLGIAQALLAQGMRVAVHYRGGREAAEVDSAVFAGDFVSAMGIRQTTECVSAFKRKGGMRCDSKERRFPNRLFVGSAIWKSPLLEALSPPVLDSISEKTFLADCSHFSEGRLNAPREKILA